MTTSGETGGGSDGEFLERAGALAVASVAAGGGPFGAVVVRDGRVLGEAANRVTLDADPTAHAEVLAIRAACSELGSHDLGGALLYTSCEPCPMCLAAAYWARIGRVVFASDRDDAAAAGFDDAFLYLELSRPRAERRLEFEQRSSPLAQCAFDEWRAKPDRIEY